MEYSLEENVFGALGHDPAEIIPPRNADGIPEGPMGYNTRPLEGSGRERLRDALVVQIDLQIPEEEIRAYLEREDVSDRSLGF